MHLQQSASMIDRHWQPLATLDCTGHGYSQRPTNWMSHEGIDWLMAGFRYHWLSPVNFCWLICYHPCMDHLSPVLLFATFWPKATIITHWLVGHLLLACDPTAVSGAASFRSRRKRGGPGAPCIGVVDDCCWYSHLTTNLTSNGSITSNCTCWTTAKHVFGKHQEGWIVFAKLKRQ